MLFEGARFCQHCGTPVESPATAMADGEAAPRYCPRCDGGGAVKLEAQLTCDHMLDECELATGLENPGELAKGTLRASNRAQDKSRNRPVEAVVFVGKLLAECLR